MLKRVDVAVYNAFNDYKNDNWSTGFSVLGVAEGGVDWALDDNNAGLISADMKAAVETAKNNIINGNLQVHDYMSDNACPM
jgi:basic membrane protein A